MYDVCLLTTVSPSDDGGGSSDSDSYIAGAISGAVGALLLFIILIVLVALCVIAICVVRHRRGKFMIDRAFSNLRYYKDKSCVGAFIEEYFKILPVVNHK